MGIRNAEIPTYPTFSQGIDDTTVVNSKDIQGTLSVALNADLVDDSLCIKRRGYTLVNSAADWGTRRVRGGLEYTLDLNTKQVLVYGEGDTVTGTSGILAKLNGTAAPTSIRTGLLDNIKPSIIQFRNLAFVFTGSESFLYDGTVTRQIGITAPTVAPSFTTTINGDLNQSASYLFSYTYYNSTTGAESSPSPLLTASTGATGTTDGIRIGLTPGDTTTADKILIYRSVGNGSVLFLEGETLISASTYDSIVADSALSDQLELDNSRLADSPKYATAVDNRIFLAGFQNNPNRIQYSKVGLNGSMPESYQLLDFVDCNINDGDKIVGIGSVNNLVIVIKEKSFGRLTKMTSIDSGLELQGSTKYIYEEISNETTAVGHHCATVLDNLYVWMGFDDIYASNGSQLLRVGRRIRSTIKSLNFTHSHKFSAINKKDSQQIIFSTVSTNATEPDFQIVGHYRNLPTVAFTYYSPGTDRDLHPGLRAGHLMEVTQNKSKIVYFGSSDAVGRVYQMDSGTNDNTKGIYWDVRLPWEGHKNPSAKKMFHSLYAFVFGNGNNYSVTMSFEQDNEANIVKSVSGSLFSTPNSFWDSSFWNTFYWASLRFIPVRFFPHLKAYFGRYGFQNYNADEPVAIKGVVSTIQYSPLHR